jgi:UDP-GlcNAc:undecaprenyl-phosphate GlcNAc-1-phosphate transferase
VWGHGRPLRTHYERTRTRLAQLAGAFALSLVASLIATPFAIRLAARTGFYDQPVGYKAHRKPTPYLGGVAVVSAFLLGAAAFGSGFDGLGPIAGGALVLWAVGTLDDRYDISPRTRLVIEAGVAAGLWMAGYGWSLFDVPILDLGLTVLWITGLVNAFNLMDNMDGAATTVASVSSAGAGALALIDGHTALAALCFALCGACAGFLPYNLRSPSRIFLGDGGSMPVGFIVAATVMAVAGSENAVGVRAILIGAVLVGLPVLDTTLVVISRRRRGISVLTGGRDHLTHRLRTQLPSARSVAFALALLQTGLCLLVIGATTLGSPLLMSAAALCFILGATAIGMLERPGWIGEPAQPEDLRAGAAGDVATATVAGVAKFDLGLLVAAGLGAGLSAFVAGLYNISAWGPFTLVATAVFIAIALARPGELPARPALAVAGALALLWIWSAVSATWADSADGAFVEAGRWLLYLTVFAVFASLLTTRRSGEVVIGAFVVGVLVVAAYTTGGLLTGHAKSVFLGGRLNEPLGYVNGQASYFLLALWPLIAVAERTRRSFVAGLAIAAAATLAGLALMTETRAILPAVFISIITLVAIFPGRDRRLWVLFAIGAAVAVAAPSLLDVYSSARGSADPDVEVTKTAIRNLLIASAFAGLVWTLLAGSARRLAQRSVSARRIVPLASRIAVTAACLAMAGAALAALGDPVERVRVEAHAFTHLATQGSESSTRFLSGGGNRYDYWRVAVDEFKDNPVKGVGAGNYAPGYFLERRTNEDIRQPHSLQLQTLAELGLVGAGALALFLTVVLMGLGRRAMQARHDARGLGLSVAAGGVFITWLIHTSVDWIHLLPGLTAIALAAAAILVAPLRRPALIRGRRIFIWPAIAVGLAVIAALSVGRLTMADHYSGQAQAQIVSDPRDAIRKADRALALDPEAIKPYYTQAAAFARLNSYSQARASLLEAARIEPANFVTWALLGDLATRRGDRDAALRAYKHASLLNPRDNALQAALRSAQQPAP